MNERDSAEVVALQALGWMASEADMIGGFLGASGLAQDEIAGRTRDPVFLAAILDFCLESDDRVLACAAALQVAPEAIGRARRALPGGADPHWT